MQRFKVITETANNIDQIERILNSKNGYRLVASWDYFAQSEEAYAWVHDEPLYYSIKKVAFVMERVS